MDKTKITLIIKTILSLVFLGTFGFSMTILNSSSPKLSMIIITGGISVIVALIISFIQDSINSKKMAKATKEISNNISKIETLEKEIEDTKTRIKDNQTQTERIETLSKIFQDSDDIKLASSQILDSIANDIEICQGVLYISEEQQGVKKLVGSGTYAYHKLESEIDSPQFGVGLVGQTAAEKKALYINELPAGYIDVVSGLGTSKPNYLALLPLIYSDNVLGVLEIASFTEFTKNDKDLFDKLQESLGAGIHFLNQTKLLESLNQNEPVGNTINTPQHTDEVVNITSETTIEEVQEDENTEEKENNDQ